MDITYFGHASFKIVSSSAIDGKKPVVVTDPFDNKVGFKFPKVEADIVTISHDHFDHNNASGVSNIRKLIDGPGEYEVMGVSMIGISTFHDDKKGEDRGRNIIFIFEIEGMRVVHLGDLGHGLSEKQVNNLGDVDVLMIPVGGEYTIDSKQAIEIVQSIEPKITIPMHYAMPGLSAELSKKLTSEEPFITHVGLPVEKASKLNIKKASLVEEKKVVLLERKGR